MSFYLSYHASVYLHYKDWSPTFKKGHCVQFISNHHLLMMEINVVNQSQGYYSGIIFSEPGLLLQIKDLEVEGFSLDKSAFELDCNELNQQLI